MNRPQSTTDRLVSLIRLRASAGLEKYGVTVDRSDLTTPQWIDHAVEELIDGAQYLLRVKDHFEARPAADAFAALQAHMVSQVLPTVMHNLEKSAPHWQNWFRVRHWVDDL